MAAARKVDAPPEGRVDAPEGRVDAPEGREAPGRADGPGDGPAGGSCRDAGFAPSASNTSSSLTIRTSTRFGVLCPTGPKLNLAAALASAPSTSGRCVSLFSAPGTLPSFRSWPITPFPVSVADPLMLHWRPRSIAVAGAWAARSRGILPVCLLTSAPGLSYGFSPA